MLELKSFYPDDLVECQNDLDFEDGTYEVYQRNVILNLFLIKNRKIQYHIVYNVEKKKRLITWTFEYLKVNDQEVHNVWRQTMDTKECDMYSSNHWELYPEHYKKRMEHQKNTQSMWNSFVDHVKDCAENDISPF